MRAGSSHRLNVDEILAVKDAEQRQSLGAGAVQSQGTADKMLLKVVKLGY